jgi:hypothetical protein
MKAYCISCGAANDYKNGQKPVTCTKCKRNINASAAPVTKPTVPSLAELMARQEPARPVAIRPSFSIEDDNDEMEPYIDLGGITSDSLKFNIEIDKPNSIKLGDALANPAPPPAKQPKNKTVTKASRKQALKSILAAQKSSR